MRLQSMHRLPDSTFTAFKNCVESAKYRDAVRKDAAQAASLGISGTPGFLLARSSTTELNGEVAVGMMSIPGFEAALKRIVDPAGTGESVDTDPTSVLNGHPGQQRPRE